MKTLAAFAWLACMALTACGSAPSGTDLAISSGAWHVAWAASHSSRIAAGAVAGRTVRMILLPNIGGDGVRVKLENTFGRSPVVFSGAFIGLAGSGAEVRSNVRLTFAGQPGLTLAPGQGTYSDAVRLGFKAFDKLALSVEVASAEDISIHAVGLTINWSAAGARGAQASAAEFEPLVEVENPNRGRRPFYWVAALDVHAPAAAGAIVLLGDSITDGSCSARDDQGNEHPDLYQRWGDVLARRLAERPAAGPRGIANVGIAGNRVLTPAVDRGVSALDRLDRDVLDRTGATHLVLFEGTNDIGARASAAAIILGQQRILEQARARGLKVIGVTLLPRGRPAPRPGWTGAQETQRLALNDWIRHRAGFDGVIDFDELMAREGPVVVQADGSSAPSIPPRWNCGDGTHPNTAGYRAMGEFIDLRLFDGKP